MNHNPEISLDKVLPYFNEEDEAHLQRIDARAAQHPLPAFLLAIAGIPDDEKFQEQLRRFVQTQQ